MEYAKDGHDLTEERFYKFIKESGLDLDPKKEEGSGQDKKEGTSKSLWQHSELAPLTDS